MTANLHAIWLDDLAPGEGSTPIWDALYAEQDAETQRVVFNACADEHTEPVAVVMDMTVIEFPTDFGSDETQATSPDESSAATPSEPKPQSRKKPAKKATPRKKPGVLADAEAKLAGVKARVKAQTDEMGGAS